MCGIVGFVGPRDDAILTRMRDAVTHRGPDAAGLFADDRISLGHRRLSIVDVAGGAQPAWNEDRTVVVVFNGEIYNHPELRPRLEARGHRFGSKADTESILHAYEEYGVDCLNHLVGMFAFVVYDTKKQTLFGARDRRGEKPLYFTPRPCGDVAFAFASEPKALRVHPALASAFTLSHSALATYLLHDYTAGRQSIFAGAHRLLPGEAFTFGLPDAPKPGLKLWSYWQPRFDLGDPMPTRDEAGGHFLRLLRWAVEKQLMADVPVGVFLSGGVDSSTLAALLAQVRPANTIRTFSIGFDDPSFDESTPAQRVADYLGTRHYRQRFAATDLLQQLPMLAEHLDEPFADPSVLPVSMLCQFARQEVKVALGGDGGDELLAGYDPFRALTAATWYDRCVPSWLHRRVIQPVADRLPASDANLPWSFKVQRFLRGAKRSAGQRLPTWMGPFHPETLARLMPDLAPSIAEIEERRRDTAAAPNVVAAALEWFQRVYLPDDILVKVDRASMRHSLEVRCPFLDPAVVEYANRLPASWKLARGRTKAFFKDALLAEQLLPADIINRTKKGFGIPIGRWLRTELRVQFENVVLNGWPSELPELKRGNLRSAWTAFLGRENSMTKEMWCLFVLGLWGNNHP